MNITKKELAITLLSYVLLVVFVLVLFSKVLMLNLVSGGCMTGTIETGSVVVANRLDCDNIRRYDIMVFRSPEKNAGDDDYYIKRVIGLPGETITIADGKVYAGMELLDDSFLPEKMEQLGDGVYQVPDGCYFMLGDNRNQSCDSRFWRDTAKYNSQYVPLEDMVAKAAVSLWPLSQAGSLAWHEDTAHEQEPEFLDMTCAACGAEKSLVKAGDLGGYVQNENGAEEWVVNVLKLRCLACGESQKAVKEAYQRGDCPACGMEKSLVEVEIGHVEMVEDRLDWVTDGPALECVSCGSISDAGEVVPQ